MQRPRPSHLPLPPTPPPPRPPPPHRRRLEGLEGLEGLGHWTPTTTVCPTPRRTRPPACCAPMARPARMATATATVSGTASKPPPAPPHLTLVPGSQDGKLTPGSNARISELVPNDAPASLPKGMEMPLGLTQFRVGLSEGRYTESFSLYVDPATGVNG